MSSLTDLTNDLNSERNALRRQREILFDISFAVGSYWGRLDTNIAGQILDKIGGSRELRDLVYEWTEEFDAAWEMRDDALQCNYIGEIDDFAIAKVNVLVTTIRLDE